MFLKRNLRERVGVDQIVSKYRVFESIDELSDGKSCSKPIPA